MNTIRTSFTLISLAVLLIFASIAYVAQAEEDLTPQERFEQLQEQTSEKKAEMETVREDKQAEMEARQTDRAAQMEERTIEMQTLQEDKQAQMDVKKEERAGALQARMQERIANLAANVSNRMEGAIVRIRQITDRFETRIATLKEKGVDTASAEAELTAARSHIDAATETLATIDAVVVAVVGSESPKEAWSTARETYRTAKDEIHASHQSLKNALALLKEAVAEAELEQGRSQAVTESNVADTDNTEQDPAE